MTVGITMNADKQIAFGLVGNLRPAMQVIAEVVGIIYTGIGGSRKDHFQTREILFDHIAQFEGNIKGDIFFSGDKPAGTGVKSPMARINNQRADFNAFLAGGTSVLKGSE